MATTRKKARAGTATATGRKATTKPKSASKASSSTAKKKPRYEKESYPESEYNPQEDRPQVDGRRTQGVGSCQEVVRCAPNVLCAQEVNRHFAQEEREFAIRDVMRSETESKFNTRREPVFSFHAVSTASIGRDTASI